MNSKEALERLFGSYVSSNCYGINYKQDDEDYNTIKQDLDRVEMLEKALDKACELLADYTGICPFSKKLMYETNCDLNCKDTYKECWKKYFMKEVLGNKWYNKPLPAYAPEEEYDYSFVNDCLQKAEKYDCERLEKLEKEIKDGTLSDGYHTFNELYEQRMYLFATIVNQNKDKSWKSFKHEDGKLCFDGDWFVVGIDTPRGSYTYHYENKYWNLFDCQELEVAKHWDGHTDKDVSRLLSLESKIENLEKENQELKNTILSLELDTCIPELRKENTKLKKVIEMLKTKLDIEMYEMHKNGVTKYYLDCSAGEVIDEQEEYTLIREVLSNE